MTSLLMRREIVALNQLLIFKVVFMFGILCAG